MNKDEELAAEREAVEQYKVAFENANDTCKQLREQLAAERDAKMEWAKACQKLREQIDTEREARQLAEHNLVRWQQAAFRNAAKLAEVLEKVSNLNEK